MPKKTRLQKLRNQTRIIATSQAVQNGTSQSEVFSQDPYFKKDLMKSIFFAVFISVFEIGLYFVYYLRVFERR